MQKFLTRWQKAPRRREGEELSECGREGEMDWEWGTVRWDGESMNLSFQVSVHHSEKEEEFTASEIHPWQGGSSQ